MIYLLFTVLMSAASLGVLKPMLYPRDHPRYVAPSLVADIPNVTFNGGLL